MEYVTGKAPASSQRTTWIAKTVLSGIFGFISVPYLFFCFLPGNLFLAAVGFVCLTIAALTWLLPSPRGHAGLPLLTLDGKGIAAHPAAQWSRWAVRVDLDWSDVERVILSKPLRGRPYIAILPTDAGACSLKLRRPTWQGKLLASWTKPKVVVLTDSSEDAPEALLDELAKAAQAAGRQPRKSACWGGGAEVAFNDRWGWPRCWPRFPRLRPRASAASRLRPGTVGWHRSSRPPLLRPRPWQVPPPHPARAPSPAQRRRQNCHRRRRRI